MIFVECLPEKHTIQAKTKITVPRFLKQFAALYFAETSISIDRGFSIGQLVLVARLLFLSGEVSWGFSNDSASDQGGQGMNHQHAGAFTDIPADPQPAINLKPENVLPVYVRIRF